MRTIQMGDGRMYSGETAQEIVQDMQTSTMFAAELPLEDYLVSMKSLALEFNGVELDISGDTIEHRCENLLQSVLDGGLARIVSKKI